MTDLEQIELTAQKARGWCHLCDEIALLAREVIKVKEELNKLKKKTKKVITDDE